MEPIPGSGLSGVLGAQEVSESTQGRQGGTCHMHKPEDMSGRWSSLGKRPVGAEKFGV